MSAVDTEEPATSASLVPYDALTAPPRRELVGLAEIAAHVCQVPMAVVNILTSTEQHTVAAVGFEEGICRAEDSMCHHILHEPRPVVVRDARLDPRFCDNPSVTGVTANVRFYAAHQLTTHDGVRFGTLCVFDEEPRPVLDVVQMATLATLADRIVDVFEVRRRGRELALALLEQDALRAELERSNERLGSFAGQVSHDLKTPLTSLSLSLALIREQLEDGETGPDLVGLLDRAINGSSRMSDLLDDVLDYAKLGGTLRATQVDLGRVMDEVAVDLEHELHDVDLQVGRLPTVLGDVAQLRAVLQNLVGNAAKYRHPERPLRITVSARTVLRAWRVEIADNGRGIPPAEHRRVFEPLARVDDSVDGAGIGLSTCRRIIGAHGGAIGIDPGARLGSTFWFELPA